MYSFCGALKASAGANAVNFYNGGIRNDGTIFWDENLKKKLKNKDSTREPSCGKIIDVVLKRSSLELLTLFLHQILTKKL